MQNKKYDYLSRYFRTYRLFRYQSGEKGNLTTILSWVVVNAHRGVEFHINQYPNNEQVQKWMIENPERYQQSKQFGIIGEHAGIEIHSPVQLDDLFPEPSIEYCEITNGKCWSDGTTLYASEFLQSLNGNLDDDLIFDEIEKYWHEQWEL